MVSPMEPTFLFKIMTGKTINYLNCFRYVFCRKIVVSALLFFIVGVQHAWAWSYVEETNTTNLGKWTKEDVDGFFKFKNSGGNNEDLPSGTGFLPAFEVWRSAADGNLTNGKITHETINSVPNGRYRLSFDYIAISGNGNDPAGAYFDINGDTGSRLTSFGSTGSKGNDKWRQGTLVKDIMITNGKLDFSIVLDGANFNWILFKNLKLESWKDFRYFEHYQGIVSEMGTAPEGLKTDYKTTTDDPRLQSGVKLQRAHEYTHDIYLLPGQTYDLEPFRDFHTSTEYLDAYHRWYDYTTDGTSSRLFIAGKSYATDNFYFDNIPQDGYVPNGFVVDDGEGHKVGGTTKIAGSRKHKFADGGDLVHVIYLAARNAAVGSATYGEVSDRLLSLQPGKYRISFSYTGWDGSRPEFNFKFYKSGSEGSPLVTSNLTPTAYHNSSDVVYDEDNYSQVIEVTSAGNYVMKWSVAAGWSGIAFGNIKLQALGTLELEDSEGHKKGYFGGKAVDGERTSASIATYTAPNSTDEIFDVIAIDVANALPESHYTQGTDYSTLKEPTLQYRHIFVIHNAKTKTDELNEQSDPAKNYTNVIRVMCPEGTPFQYRLENFEYRGWGSSAKPTGFYHKTGDNTYEPVYHYRVEIREGTKTGDGYTYNTILGSTAGNRSYNGSGIVIGTHSKTAVSIPYNEAEEELCNNMKDNLVYTYKCTNGYDAAIYLKKPTVGHYQIRVYAINASSADSYTDIKTYDSTTHDYTSNTLILQEFELEVLPNAQANMVDEETMNKDDFAYKYQRPNIMQAEYGKPTTVVNFDDIKPEDVVADSNGDGYYKWPWQWESSAYGFGYDKRYDYNMYMVANRSNKTPFNASGDIYDRLYADTNGEKKGFFLYANAASDPTRMAVLNIGNNLCIGSRIYVSAWINEFNTWPETANVVFAFKGVKKDGTEVILNNYVTGYVPGGCNTKDGFDNIPNHGDDVNGERSTTDPDYRRKWMHVYYYFDPQFDEFSGASNSFDHFIISLENNCTGSFGADYAIDDIRAFVCKPLLNALQENPVCNGDPATKLKLSTDFDRLLPAIGHKEATESTPDKFYYCFIDSAAYVNTFERTVDSLVAKGKSETEAYSEAYPIAFNAAMVKKVYGYQDGSTTEFEEYGVLKYNRHFESNLAAPTSAEEEATMPERTAYRESYITKRLLNFPSNSNVNDTKIRFGTKYWAVMEGALTRDTNGNVDLPNTFDLRDNCTSKNLFEVIFSGEIKVDGMLRSEQDGINICTNQRPVITIDLNGISADTAVVTKNAYFDWYFGPGYAPGTGEDYTEYLDMEVYNGVKLVEALEGYRLRYPTATATTKADFLLLPTDGSALDPNDPVYTDGMQACIAHYLDLGMIALYQQSGIVSSAKYSDILAQGEVRKYYISAVPWNPTPENETVKYCLMPIQITLKADTRYPTMKVGNDDPNQVTYPTEIRDVPLRTGLRHLQAASHLKYVDPEDVGAVIPTKPSYILLPLRDVKPITPNIKKLGLAEDVLIYLADSDDPWVNALYKNEKGRFVSKSGAKIVKVYDDEKHYQGDWSNTDVKFIGEVLEINADKTELGSYCKLAFYEDFKFREGYYYTIKFMFNEIYEIGYTGVKDAVCPGEVICTIKVVPEYQKWTGAVDANWNNDKNWTRVSYADLKYDVGTMTDDENDVWRDFVTDGEIADIPDLEGKKDTYANDNKRSYVPAEFTKVIIPADAPNKPIMYDLRNEANVTKNVKYAGSPVSCYGIKYMTPQEAVEEGKTTEIPYYKEYAELIDTATANINFDMASIVITDENAKTEADKANKNMVACISWFDHTCEQIHFESGAEMMNQQFLHYERASADFEIKPGRWFTLSSPIKNVVAGDMYLPTATARQETPYFKDITYSTALNDRFKPAVYQRKWNADMAKTYKLGVDTPENAAEGISLDWSHVYNDVNENYGTGLGFSIKADISAMPETDRPDLVMFRLPKADTEYTYYNPGNKDGDKRTEDVTAGLFNNERTARLVDSLTVVGGERVEASDGTVLAEGYPSAGNYDRASQSKFFLVGNPFMCTIDMKQFFAANEGLEPKFWVVTEEGQRATVMSDEIYGDTSDNLSTLDNDKFTYPFIKPFQSFFVELKDDATGTTFTPKFTAGMMHLATQNDVVNPNEQGQGLVRPANGGDGNDGSNAKTRAAASTPSGILRITASDGRGLESKMVLTDGAIRHTSGAETLFDSNLADEPMVYSVIGGQAMTIGEMTVGETIPVGLAGIEGEATITLTGIEEFESPLYLTDALTGDTEPITSDITLHQSGNGVRYYLISPKQASDSTTEQPLSAPVLKSEGKRVTVTAPAETELTDLRIVTTGGMNVTNVANAGSEYSTELAEGIYIITLRCNNASYTYKVAIW